MDSTGEGRELERVAEPEGGPTTECLRTQAADLNVGLTGSVPTHPADGGRHLQLLPTSRRFMARYSFSCVSCSWAGYFSSAAWNSRSRRSMRSAADTCAVSR